MRSINGKTTSRKGTEPLSAYLRHMPDLVEKVKAGPWEFALGGAQVFGRQDSVTAAPENRCRKAQTPVTSQQPSSPRRFHPGEPAEMASCLRESLHSLRTT